MMVTYPQYLSYSAIENRRLEKLRAKAAKQVREKFPNLIEGSSGWNRAFNNRLSRLRTQR